MRAIDVHIHVPERPGVQRREIETSFRSGPRPTTAEELYESYKSLDIFGIIFSVDSESNMGTRFTGNDWVAEIVKKYPDQFMGFASVDPWKGKMAVSEIERCVKELGLRGLKLQPITQGFAINDVHFYPLWEKCQELGVPILTHTGQTAIGSGAPGGRGLKLKYGDPMLVDDVAADFPELKIIMAHPGVPWQEEQLAVLVHKSNVYMDLSGWSPKYFRPILVQYANSLVQDKCLFGSDYPGIRPDRWLADFEGLDLKPEVRQKILLDNAKKLFGL